ncbi:TPA: hypothetical protein N0F65_001916 [Lagenidium giganteum]|uniref:PI31 proteasome regulator N-terminal domain-containing protein n=1 Tax=Lagenidium giganteum TaxID=4803 RepID=A0AAV2Z236_9STRA|nr:TPA: hypothetical protein N0F65_001916 [Lagenidium giganteum]
MADTNNASMEALRTAISGLADERLRVHMQQALDAYPASSSSTAASTNDAIVLAALRKNGTNVQAPRDALFLAVHVLLKDLGFVCNSTGATGDLKLPSNWDANSAAGLFSATYTHPHDSTLTFTLQGLFVGNKFEVYISDNKDHTHSIELDVPSFIKTVEAATTPVLAVDCLKDTGALRARFAGFAQPIVPPAPQPAAPTTTPAVPTRSPYNREPTYLPSSPYDMPRVGGGDIFPPGLGGGDPGSLVGPGHPLFGGRGYDPSVGPVPGARFDPFGPVGLDPMGPSGFGRPRPRGPAPNMPFGGPNPDHLRMPRDDTFDSRMGGGSSRPFGSDHSFF